MAKKTAAEIVAILSADNPDRFFAAATNGGSVAVWHDGEWIPCASQDLRGEWFKAPHVLVNGENPYPQSLYGPRPIMEKA
jgi:hypothetical protein